MAKKDIRAAANHEESYLAQSGQVLDVKSEHWPSCGLCSVAFARTGKNVYVYVYVMYMFYGYVYVYCGIFFVYMYMLYVYINL